MTDTKSFERYLASKKRSESEIRAEIRGLQDMVEHLIDVQEQEDTAFMERYTARESIEKYQQEIEALKAELRDSE